MTALRWIVCALVSVSALAGPAFSAEDAPEELLRRAERAYERREDDRAERLYREFAEDASDDPRADVARYRAAQAALRQGAFGRALEGFMDVSRSNGPLSGRARYYVGLTLYRERGYQRAFDLWGEAVRTVEDDEIASRAQYGRAWSALRLHEWRVAQRELTRMKALFPGRALTRRALELARELESSTSLPRRSPGRAKWLSTLVPGAGQVYAGRPGNGLISFALNATFFYFAGKAIADRRWVDLGFIYVIGSRFYWGGRENAEAFARQYNRRAEERFVESLEPYER